MRNFVGKDIIVYVKENYDIVLHGANVNNVLYLHSIQLSHACHSCPLSATIFIISPTICYPLWFYNSSL